MMMPRRGIKVLSAASLLSPPSIPAVIAGVAALIAGWSACTARSSRNIANAAKLQTRDLVAEATARGFVKEWNGAIRADKQANAINILQTSPIDNDKYNDINEVFNWFDHMAQEVAENRATPKIVIDAELQEPAKSLLEALKMRD